MLYYELYVGGSVSPLFLQKLHMSFTFLVYTLAVGNLIGAFGSLFAGLTDRLGHHSRRFFTTIFQTRANEREIRRRSPSRFRS